MKKGKKQTIIMGLLVSIICIYLCGLCDTQAAVRKQMTNITVQDSTKSLPLKNYKSNGYGQQRVSWKGKHYPLRNCSARSSEQLRRNRRADAGRHMKPKSMRKRSKKAGHRKAIYKKYESKLRRAGQEDREATGFDQEGNFVMVTRDQIATSSKTYRTIGWTIKRYPFPIDWEGNESVRIRLESDGQEKIDPEDPAYAFHYFQCSKETIYERLGQVSEDWKEDLYKNGGYVYLDAVMTLADNGILKGYMDAQGDLYGQVYLTYEGIKGAEQWSDPTSLATHFDKKVYFPANEKMLYGTYELHYIELTEDGEIPLTILGLDIDNKPLKAQVYDFEPEETGQADLDYEKTEIITKKKNKRTKKEFTKRKYRVDNRDLEYESVKVAYYFSRKEYVQKGTLQYGQELLWDNRLEISAEAKGSPKFDVQKGIPVTEDLRLDAKIQRFTYDIIYEKHWGRKAVPVEVRVFYALDAESEDGGTETVTEKKLCYVLRDYVYYTVKAYRVTYAKKLIAFNYSFPEGQVEVSGLYEPKLVFRENRDRHLLMPDQAAVVLYGGKLEDKEERILTAEEIQAAADRACGKLQVRNDYFALDDDVILKDRIYEERAAGPDILEGRRDQQIEEGQIKILPTKQNGCWESKALVCYGIYGSEEGYWSKFQNVNPVVIHTPVVCKASASDEKQWNQEVEPTKYHSLILGRDFKVGISGEGTHKKDKGYGKQDYSRYSAAYQVKFPFQVYEGEKLIDKDRWIRLKAEENNSQCFYLPVGVEEGDYKIDFRSLALNYKSIKNGEEKIQPGANLSVENYCATDQIKVTVVGRLYGMEITDIADRPRWSGVFYRQEDGLPTGFTYRIGLKNCNGEEIQGISAKKVFPIIRGSHPIDTLAGPVRIGYQISFRLKTIGSMEGKEDKIALKPVFYYIDENGKNRRKVSLYDKKNLNKIEQCLILDKSQRSFQKVNKKNVSDSKRQEKCLQVWQGQYGLSPDILLADADIDLKEYIAGKGNRISPKDPVFLKKGYLLVGFQIRSVKKGKPHLDYINVQNQTKGYCNMWKEEGYLYHRRDSGGISWNFQDGDMLLFDRGSTIYDDYEVVGTH